MTYKLNHLLLLSFNKSEESYMNKQTPKRTGFKKEPMIYIQTRSVRTKAGLPASLT